ncbi:hypothetical protein [Streptomyces tauricus]|uniref:hypothetical protein n=1 Tax=Streptomyces tauricus TaxID=68274 RepID=UPI0033BBC3F3
MDMDKRRIQTAVLGDPESDEPLICPTEISELDALLQETDGMQYYCGLLLGGCGGELIAKRCNHCVCHFAHAPDPEGLLPECVRRARGGNVSSADHLYVKSATQAWFRRQGHAPRYRFVDHDDAPVGSIVDISLGGHRLRVHVNSSVPLDWDDKEQNTGEVILGPGVHIDRRQLVRQRYVNRVKFETVDGDRIMKFGTETPYDGTWWFDPSECEVTAEGRLKTPVVEQVWNTEPEPPAAAKDEGTVVLAEPAAARPAVPDTGVPVRISTLLRRINGAVRAEEIAVTRQLCQEAEGEADGCQGLVLYEVQSIVEKAQAWLATQDRIRRVLFARLKEAEQARNAIAVHSHLKQLKTLLARGEEPTEVEAEVLRAAEGLVAAKDPETEARRRQRVTEHQADTTLPYPREERRQRRLAAAQVRSLMGLLKPAHNLSAQKERRLTAELAVELERAGDGLSVQERHEAEQLIEKVDGRPQSASSRSVAARIGQPQLPPDTLTRAADAVRGALKKNAREQSTTTWAHLRQRLGSALPRMGMADRAEVLVLVDQTTPTDQALLSALVAAGDPTMTDAYRVAAGALGLDTPDDDADLQDVLEADVQQVHKHWRYQ